MNRTRLLFDLLWLAILTPLFLILVFGVTA